ncbi:50S ribosomal protein L5 [Candidatus Microgenomates bacterium]|nr:MAG: 50S ribosomal protein L5 [Candidatus Microgenomates bacterium]
MTELQKKMKNEIVSKLQKDLGIKNPMALPVFSKIIVNMGVKNALADKKNIERGSVVMAQITGQKPKVTKAKKSISTFKLREGDSIGLVVTLRGKRMHEFFEKLTNVILPRLRDFHGVSEKSFDGHGNYSLGFSEFSVFPEIDPGKIDQNFIRQGLEIVIVTTAKNDKEGRALLGAYRMPFIK